MCLTIERGSTVVAKKIGGREGVGGPMVFDPANVPPKTYTWGSVHGTF
jgi:hypothetical protein